MDERRVLLGPVPCAACRLPVEWLGDGWVLANTWLVHNKATCRPQAALPERLQPVVRLLERR